MTQKTKLVPVTREPALLPERDADKSPVLECIDLGITFGGLQQAGSPWSSAAKAKWHYTHCPADNVTKWNTPILCIHGGMDFRIPYDQGMAAFNAAQMMGVPSKLIVFPDECHWILKPQNALFWHREYFDWLDQWCK